MHDVLDSKPKKERRQRADTEDSARPQHSVSQWLITEWEAKIGPEKVSALREYIDTIFELGDTDNNGVLTKAEFAQARGDNGVEWVFDCFATLDALDKDAYFKYMVSHGE